MRNPVVLVAAMMMALLAAPVRAESPLVFYTDFGTADGAVSAMKGVAYGVSQKLLISDLSHENPGSLFAGAYRLFQVENYWPKGTVFVSVIDPGVGTARLSIVLKTRTGNYFVSPNNGLLTLVAERDGIEELRQIDEKVNRLPGSENSNTFHGRDVFGYTGARLAAGVISFDQVGPKLPPETLVTIPYQKPERHGNTLTGFIPVLDIQFGNVWSNIPKSMIDELGVAAGDHLRLRIRHEGKLVTQAIVPFQRTFGDVPVGQPLIYINSLLCVSVALNQDSYAARHRISSGAGWTIEVSRLAT